MPEVIIQMLGGNCPVQAEGTINGQPFYFRARGDSWRMNIGDWSYEEDYGTGPFDAGWMTEDEARAFIKQSADKFAMHRDQSTEDEWWERVFSAKDLIAVENGCDRWCFTFACECRRSAIANVTRETGVSFADQE